MNNRSALEDQLKQLTARLDRLEELVQTQTQRTYALEKRLAEESSSNQAPSPLSPGEKSLAPERAEPELAPSVASNGLTEIGQPQPHANPPLASAAPATNPPARESMESLIGGNWLNKAGVIAIVLGVAYFLKYAIDSQWIGERGRVVLGILTGLGFLLWGERLQKKHYPAYAIGISGGGIAILYFTLFAAFNFYSVMAQLPAFFLMVLVTTTAVLMALRYDSKAIAFLGIIGGFLTPVMLSTGKDNQVALFSYIALLDLGILALAYFKNWRGLNLLAFGLTQLMFLVWTSTFYIQAKLWRTEFFLTLFFFIFAMMSFLHNFVHQQKTSSRDLFLILLNGAAYFLWTYALLESKYFDYLGFYAVLMAAIYVGQGAFVYQRARQDVYLFLTSLGMGLTFLTLAIPIQLEQNWIAVGWAVEAVVLAWVGFRLGNGKTRLASLLILGLVAIRLLFYDSEFNPGGARYFTFLFNKRSFTFAVGILAIFALAYLYAQHREKLTGLESGVMGGLVVLANFLLLFFLTTEFEHHFEIQYYRTKIYELQRVINSQKQLSVSALWALYSMLLVAIGIARRYQLIRLLAIILFGLTIFKVFLLDLSELEKIYRIISFIGLGIILLTASFMYQKYRNQINDFVLK